MLSCKLQKEIWRDIPHKFQWLGVHWLGSWAVYSKEPRLSKYGRCEVTEGIKHNAVWYIQKKYLRVLADLPASVTLLKRPKGV